MKIETNELTGAALDWAVAKAWQHVYSDGAITAAIRSGYSPSTDWAQGGQIIEQEGIGLLFDSGSACRSASWFATPDDQATQESYEGESFDPAFMVDESVGVRGPTPLIAAMRCYVASKLGDEVDVPEELCK